MIDISREKCSDPIASMELEWLETNGIGGYAMSSVSGANTRRYHGLLIAAAEPPLGRIVMLSKFEETLVIGDERYDISCNRYAGNIFPEGYKYIKGFRLDPFPIWTYEAGGLTLERSFFMPHGMNAAVIRWNLNVKRRPSEVKLEVRPLLAFRDHHHLRRDTEGFDTSFETGQGRATVRPIAGMPELNFIHNAADVGAAGHWYLNFEYAVERERGFDHNEDLFQPFSLAFDLTKDAFVIASAGERPAATADDLEKAEIKRRAELVVRSEEEGSERWPLVLAADQFVVDRGSGKTVIAGYPWFSDWGRDTMIALPGLTLATGRPDIALAILTEFAEHISEGMLPNRFPDEGQTPDYNTVDATLWFFEAIRAYSEITGDLASVKERFYDRLVEIIDWHVRGTRFDIHVDTDGLLHAGVEGSQLTWMDAKSNGRAVTPRIGKPVEIQALWYNALCIMSEMAVGFGDDRQQARYSEMDEVARDAFNGQFWNAEDQCLYDVVHDLKKDAAIRPNQIFAVSLHHTMLDAERARSVVKKVESELLTPYGLRSLSPRDPAYVGVYAGSPAVRDAGYHQGTVWSWLIGPFVEAYRKVHSDDVRSRRRIDEITEGLRTHIAGACVGQVSEIFDGDAPHRPRGCPAQAWSVAELLRVTAFGKTRSKR